MRKRKKTDERLVKPLKVSTKFSFETEVPPFEGVFFHKLTLRDKLARAVILAKTWLKRNWRKIFEVDKVLYGLVFISAVLFILVCMKILSSTAIIIVQ